MEVTVVENRALQVITLGEAMAVMDPLARGRLRHVNTFGKHVGGAELNVAVALARLGHRSGWTGLLGDDEFGNQILSFASGEGVDISRAHLVPGATTGLYFKERGALGQRKAYYYRTGSAASGMRFEELDLDYLLSGEVLHLTGITPTLSESCLDLVERLLEEANERGKLVSFDANVRWRLFRGRDPREMYESLVERADLLFLSDEEAELLLGGSDPDTIRQSQKGMRAQAVILHEAAGSFVVGDDVFAEKEGYIAEVVDTVGAGDAFVAGFLSGWLRKWTMEDCLGLANACGACAVSVPGDAESMPTEEEALGLLQEHPIVER